MKVEYKVRKVERFIVTCFEEHDEGMCGSRGIGEYSSHRGAYDVAYACAKLEHERLGYPLGDERIKYPTPPPPSVTEDKALA